jgi:hypothetical protein
MTEKSAAYYEGVREEQARQTAKALGLNPAALAQQVARNIAKDELAKRRIFSRGLTFSVDAAEEVAEMSARELAARELKSLGIEPGDNDPVALLDAHHAGRQYERTKGVLGSARDSASSGGSFLDKYLADDGR